MSLNRDDLLFVATANIELEAEWWGHQVDLPSLFSWFSSWFVLAYFNFLFSPTLDVVENLLRYKPI